MSLDDEGRNPLNSILFPNAGYDFAWQKTIACFIFLTDDKQCREIVSTPEVRLLKYVNQVREPLD
jgi:hypothetical protein